jgi:endonuclease V-like protein UPF0215 family
MIIVAGVVFRGSSWLDGIATCAVERNERDYHSQIVRTIMKSKQYSQLHAIILRRDPLIPGWGAVLTKLAHEVNLPAIAIGSSKSSRARGQLPAHAQRYDLAVKRYRIPVVVTGCKKDEAERLFNVGCGQEGKIPEAVRVADLVAREATHSLSPRRNR